VRLALFFAEIIDNKIICVSEEYYDGGKSRGVHATQQYTWQDFQKLTPTGFLFQEHSTAGPSPNLMRFLFAPESLSSENRKTYKNVQQETKVSATTSSTKYLLHLVWADDDAQLMAAKYPESFSYDLTHNAAEKGKKIGRFRFFFLIISGLLHFIIFLKTFLF
jgi:hypothetical protein